MRAVFLFFALTLHALSGEITFSQKLKTLEIFIPLNTTFSANSQEDSLIFILNTSLTQEKQTQFLSTPFQKIQILPLSPQQTQITIWGKNLSFSEKKTDHSICLEIHSDIVKISWWKYFYVCFILALIMLALLYLKKRGTLKNVKYKEVFLSTKSKIISFEYEGKEYVIFSNERGNVLLNHYPKEPHNKDFTHFISED